MVLLQAMADMCESYTCTTISSLICSPTKEDMLTTHVALLTAHEISYSEL